MCAWLSSVLDKRIVCMLFCEGCLVRVGEVEIVDAADEGWEGVGGRGEEGGEGCYEGCFSGALEGVELVWVCLSYKMGRRKVSI